MEESNTDLLENFSVFRVCDLQLHNRQMIGCAPNIQSVLEHGAIAMRKKVDRILLASDGCEITSDLVLNALQGQMMILLSPGEMWVPYTPSNLPYEPKSGSVPYDPSINPPYVFVDPNTPSTSTCQESSDNNEQTTRESLPDAKDTLDIDPSDPVKVMMFIEEGPAETPKSPVNDQQNQLDKSSGNEENHSPNVQRKRPAEPIVVEKPKRRATTDMKFQSFRINWDKLSVRLVQQLDQLQKFWEEHPKQQAPREIRITNDDLNEIIAVVVDQLRLIDKAISARTMEIVAKEIIAQYPCLDYRLTADDDGCKGGKGYIGIKSKLIHRNTYRNRFKDEEEDTQSRATKTKMRHVQSGTLKEYWQKTSEQCDSKVMSVLRRDETDLLTNDLLCESQAHVRYLFDTEDLEELLSRLPVLRRTVLLNFHFEKATGVNVSDLSKYLLAKQRKIIDFSRKSKKRTLGEEASTRDILNFLMLLVGEKIEDLIIQKQMGTNLSAITTDIAGPVLVCIDMGDDSCMFYVFAEKTRLTEGTPCILEALQNLMAVYYVHNFMYVERCSKILELIQQYFLKILPETGSKSQATKVDGRQRVVKRIILQLSTHDVIDPR